MSNSDDTGASGESNARDNSPADRGQADPIAGNAPRSATTGKLVAAVPAERRLISALRSTPRSRKRLGWTIASRQCRTRRLVRLRDRATANTGAARPNGRTAIPPVIPHVTMNEAVPTAATADVRPNGPIGI